MDRGGSATVGILIVVPKVVAELIVLPASREFANSRPESYARMTVQEERRAFACQVPVLRRLRPRVPKVQRIVGVRFPVVRQRLFGI